MADVDMLTYVKGCQPGKVEPTETDVTKCDIKNLDKGKTAAGLAVKFRLHYAIYTVEKDVFIGCL